MPTKKLKKYEREYQMMRENQLQQEDPLDRYKVMGCHVLRYFPLEQKKIAFTSWKERSGQWVHNACCGTFQETYLKFFIVKFYILLEAIYFDLFYLGTTYNVFIFSVYMFVGYTSGKLHGMLKKNEGFSSTDMQRRQRIMC